MSVLHAHAALESQVSLLGYQMLFDTESSRYLKLERRTFAVERLTLAWTRMPLET